MTADRITLARDLVALEAQLLDEQAWDAWLALYMSDAVLWVPAWRSESEPTTDPDTELSLMSLDGHRYLAERVHRVTSGRSVASTPVPRTAHVVTGSLVTLTSDATALVKSAWASHVYDHKSTTLTTYAGRYRHELAWVDGGWRIAKKTVLLINDMLVSKLDFFYI